MSRQNAGFGVVEVLITIVILGTVSLSLVGMFQGILYVQSAANYRKTATFAAQRQIESLRNSNYNDLDAGTTINFSSSLPTDLPSPRTGSAAITEPVAGLKRVDVTVTYRHAGQDKQVKVSSMIGVIGISQ